MLKSGAVGSHPVSHSPSSMTLDSNADSNDLVSMQSLEDDEVLILLLQLRECMDSSSLEALSLAFHEFTNDSIGKNEYNSKVAKLCPPAATFLWNRLVRSVFYEDYKHEQSLPSSSHAISDEEEDAEEEEEGNTKKRKGGGSHQKRKKKKKVKKEEEGAESRVRNEWTPQEDRIFLEGLKKYSLNFREIAQLLPNR
jgi:hypothetical protein